MDCRGILPTEACVLIPKVISPDEEFPPPPPSLCGEMEGLLLSVTDTLRTTLLSSLSEDTEEEYDCMYVENRVHNESKSLITWAEETVQAFIELVISLCAIITISL